MLWMAEPRTSFQVTCLPERKMNLILSEPCILECLCCSSLVGMLQIKPFQGKTRHRANWLVCSAFLWGNPPV